jgi:hypothetical protein
MQVEEYLKRDNRCMVQALWAVAVKETRELLEQGWV